MNDWQHGFTGATTGHSSLYDQILVPAVFHPWACYLAGAIGPRAGVHALDVACGTGALTRVLAAAAGPAGAVTGTDLSDAMLAAARAKPVLPGAPQVYHQSPAAPLAPFADGSFDLTCCQHGLQFFPDRPAAVAEWYRVTKPGGTLAVAIWAPLEDNPLFAALHDAAAALLGPDHGRQFARPWALPAHEARVLIEQAGFTDAHHHRARLPTIFPGGTADLLNVYRFSPVADALTALAPAARQDLEEAVHGRLAPYRHGAALTAPTSVEIILATR